MTSTTSAPSSPQEAVEVRTENLFQRTEVLAGMYQHSSLLFPAVGLRLLPVSVSKSSRSAPGSSRWIILRECFHGLCQWQTSKSWKRWNYFPYCLPSEARPKITAFIRLHFRPAVGPRRVHSRGCFPLWNYERWRKADDGSGNLCSLWRRLTFPAWLRRTLIGTSHLLCSDTICCWREAEKQEEGQIRTAGRRLDVHPASVSILWRFISSLLVRLKQS